MGDAHYTHLYTEHPYLWGGIQPVGSPSFAGGKWGEEIENSYPWPLLPRVSWARRRDGMWNVAKIRSQAWRACLVSWGGEFVPPVRWAPRREGGTPGCSSSGGSSPEVASHSGHCVCLPLWLGPQSPICLVSCCCQLAVDLWRQHAPASTPMPRRAGRGRACAPPL